VTVRRSGLGFLALRVDRAARDSRTAGDDGYRRGERRYAGARVHEATS
jgi:hypothetical protein